MSASSSTGSEQVTVPAGTFETVFGGPDIFYDYIYEGTGTLWVAPGVGVVQFYYYDEDESLHMTFKMTSGTAPNVKPNTPTVVSPTQNAANLSLTPTLSGNAFSDFNATDTFAASQWQISTHATFSSTVWDYLDNDANPASEQLPSGVLQADAGYLVRVRYKDNQGAWSDWSQPVSFSTQVEKYMISFSLGLYGQRTGRGQLHQLINSGGAAQAPVVTASTGWRFTGWDTSLTNITSSKVINAC